MWLLYMRETFLVQCIEHAVIRRLYSRIRDAYLLHPLGIQSFVTFTIGTFQYRVQPNAERPTPTSYPSANPWLTTDFQKLGV